MAFIVSFGYEIDTIVQFFDTFVLWDVYSFVEEIESIDS